MVEASTFTFEDTVQDSRFYGQAVYGLLKSNYKNESVLHINKLLTFVELGVM